MQSIEENTPVGLARTIVIDNWGEYVSPADIEVVHNPVNVGWAKSNNQAAEMATTPFLVMLNNDTEVTENWLTELLSAFDDPAVGVAGARLHYPNGAIQHSGIAMTRHRGGVSAENRHDEHPTEDVQGVTGACLAIRSDVFKQVGGVDEDFYNGADDCALCLAVTEAGWRIRYVSTCRVMHIESASGPERWVRVHENVRLLNEKWGLRG